MLKIPKGNDAVVAIPFELKKVTDEGVETSPFDFSTVQSMKVSVIGRLGVLLGFTYSTDADVLTIVLPSDAMVCDTYGVEARLEMLDGQKLRFFRSGLFEIVNETQTEGGPEGDVDYLYYELGTIGVTSAGASAYDIAVARGFVGTQEEWLESLNGKSLYELMVDAGLFEGTLEEFLAKYDTYSKTEVDALLKEVAPTYITDKMINGLS